MFTVQADLFYRFGAALLIGILIGVERERAADLREMRLFAGVRTISLIALAGCAGGLLSDIMNSPWPLVAVIFSMGGLIIAAYMRLSGDGSTSEVAAFVALLCGALCYWEYISLAAAIAVVTTMLLSFKVAMHGFVRRLSTEDIYSTLKFAAITAIILPILPDRSFGPPPLRRAKSIQNLAHGSLHLRHQLHGLCTHETNQCSSWHRTNRAIGRLGL